MNEYFQSKYTENFIKDITEVILQIKNLFDIYNIHYIIIGGASLSEYHYNRLTTDVDILVSKNDKEKIMSLPIGFINVKSPKRLFLQDPQTKIEIIYSDEVSGDGVNGLKFKEPDNLASKNNPVYISLFNLIQYKLSSGLYGHLRLRDFADVQELIRLNKLPKSYCDLSRDDIKNKYLEIWKQVNTPPKNKSYFDEFNEEVPPSLVYFLQEQSNMTLEEAETIAELVDKYNKL
jgi:hypothetical protein